MNTVEALQWCEGRYMAGMTDESSGSVEAPTGFFYRCGRYIVTTDNYGFKTLQKFSSEGIAQEVFESLDREFARWEDT